MEAQAGRPRQRMVWIAKRRYMQFYRSKRPHVRVRFRWYNPRHWWAAIEQWRFQRRYF